MSTPPKPATRPLETDRSLSLLLDDSFALYRAHLGLFLALAAAVVVPIELLVSGVGLGQLTSGYDSDPPVSAFALTAGVSVLLMVPLITVMIVRVLVEVEGRRRPTLGEAIRAGLDLFAPVLLAVILVAAIIAVGLFALIVPGIIAAVHLAVVMQSIVVEGTRGTGALKRSWELVRGDAWWTLGVLLVTNLLASLLAAIVTLPGAAGAEAADVAAIGLATTIIGEIFTLSFLAVVNTLLFFSLRARKEGAGRAVSEPGWTTPSDPHAAPGAPEGTPAPPSWDPPGPREDDRPSADPPPARPAPPPGWTPPAPGGWEPPRPGR
jgi:hypothetical protein